MLVKRQQVIHGLVKPFHRLITAQLFQYTGSGSPDGESSAERGCNLTLFKHDVVNPVLLEDVGQREPGHAAADDDCLERSHGDAGCEVMGSRR